MRIECHLCGRVAEFADTRPSFCAYCGQPFGLAASTTDFDPEATGPAPAAPAGPAGTVPERVGDYRLLHLLGKGGMGVVYEAEEIASGRRVAVKLLTPEFATSAGALERFRREGRLASLLSHPSCVFTVTADEEAGQPYIVMELVAGPTLMELVARQGPLPPADAVAKILDVIAGLEEAHQRGIIHRDVKPSNCFLGADGRVKVGDFGLAKSLVGDAHLTQTGRFLGTPLFAAPEQLKGEVVDERADVYSVAATLYYLLAGQTPHLAKDGAAAVARIASEPPRPLRAVRPDLPPGLEKAVLRGLERQPGRRWQDLAQLRSALLPFVPAQLSVAGLGIRWGAYLIDLLLFWLAWGALQKWLAPLVGLAGPGLAAGVLKCLAYHVPWFLYFFLLEGLWGASLGKRWLRLRVTNLGGGRPGLGKTLVRTGILYLFVGLTWDIAALVVGTPGSKRFPVSWFLPGVGFLGGLVLISSMRARNGYRGLHELGSGTQVVILPWPRSRRLLRRRRKFPPVVDHPWPDGVPEQVGPFRVGQVLRWEAEEKVLRAEDLVLGRKVWLWLRPANSPPLDSIRCALGRQARLRWLTGGEHGELRWDAFVVPAGAPLSQFVDDRTGLTWREARPILEQLSEELAAACRDGTLPPCLTLDQVWVQPNGRTQLLDTPLGSPVPVEPGGPTDQARALSFLRQVAALALEGRPRPAELPPAPVRAVVPTHAREVLDRLFGVKDSYQQVEEVAAALEATRHLPPELTRARRAAHLVLLGLLLLATWAAHVTIGLLYLEVYFLVRMLFWSIPRPNGCAYTVMVFTVIFFSILLVPPVWIIWAFLARGGWSFAWVGISLVRWDGRRPGRFRCAWRALLCWLPVVLVALLWLSYGWPLIVLGLGYAVLALVFPERSLHDRLAGTRLVPR
jgi:uncharacterized RDD family membrane protein YckC